MAKKTSGRRSGKKKQKLDEDLLTKALSRFEKIELVDRHNRDSALSSMKFVYNIDNGQWPQSIRDERSKDGRPCLTSNKLRKFVAQVANRERDQRLACNARPVDDKGDPDVAEILSGMIRQIEYASDAQKVYTDAGEMAVAGNVGYWRIVTRESDDSFDQELLIKKVPDQFSVYLDPHKMFGFIRESITKDEFAFNYPDAREEHFRSTSITEDGHDLWYNDERIIIAEYYYKEREVKTIYELSNTFTGESIVVPEAELDKYLTPPPPVAMDTGQAPYPQPAQWSVVREKNINTYKVKWCKMTASQILETGEWAGKEIPIIEVEGDWVNLNGKIYKRSLVDDAMDDQRMYNFWKTNMTETIALAPKAPYLVTTGMIKGHETYWNNANKKNLPYLPFNPQGKFMPRRENPPQVPTGSAAMLQLTAGDIQDTIGMYDSSFGERSNERTGVAIRQKASRSDFGTFHFPDNFRRAIMETARQLIDLIPRIYDTERVVRILGVEGASQNPQEDLRTVNVPEVKAAMTGVPQNDLKVGKYDVVADVKTWSTRRQEMLDGMTSIAQAAPNMAMFLLPRIAEGMDWPGHQDIADEIKQYLPSLMGNNNKNAPQQEGGEGPPEAVPGEVLEGVL